MSRLLAIACAAALLAAAPAAGAEAPIAVTRADGAPADWKALAQAMDESQVVFVGEEHDDATGHALERQLLALARERAKAARRPLVLGLEMFERDVQVVLDEYVTGLVREKDMLRAARPWPNYERDYRPLIEYAREEGLMVLASNAPERYVSRVGRLGAASLGALGPEARAWLAPLPYAGASAAYAAKLRTWLGEGDAAHPRVSQDLLDAQALRDATMAEAIARVLAKHPTALVLHLNGRFHSDHRLGLPEQLAGYRPGTRVRVITLATGEDATFEPGRREDFLIRRAASAGTPPTGAGTPSPAPSGPTPAPSAAPG